MITRGKRLLLTGISGSIGCHVFAHIMHNTDWHVIGVSSFRHKGWSDKISHMFINHPDWQERLTMVTHDIVGPFSELTKKKIGQVDYIINMASLSDVEASIKDPVTFIQNNVWIALNMLEYARECKPEIFIQISTDETSGPSEEGEQFEEWSPTLPSNPYAASKACQEAIAISHWRTYNVPVVITNTVNNFGEMQSASKFPVIVQKKIAKGEVVPIHGKEGEIGSRFYLHSRNFADALIFIIQNLPPYMHEPNKVDRPDRYNITGKERITNLEFAQIIAKLMGEELQYEFVDHHSTRPGHDRHYGLSGKKLESLGWTPPLSFEKSLKNVIDWQQSNDEWIQ